ncbi:phosphatidylinositol kinase- protein kinase tor1 [Coemansia sp. RSA 2322]|nr:phosphatidylinositol kinase- protein kinase tor1 [Coemansia sp. RSA 2322]
MTEHLRADLLSRLRSKDAAIRANASVKLYKQIADAEADGKHGIQNPLYVELNARLVKHLGSSDIQDRLECTAILSALVDIDVLDDTQLTRILFQLKSLLAQPNLVVSTEAVAIYKRLVNTKRPMVMASVESEINRSLEWLGGERSEVRRMTALLIIEVLCTGASSSLFTYIPKILTLLSPHLRDHKTEIRLAASRALGACLSMLPGHEMNSRSQWLNFLFEEQQRAQGSGSVEGCHAALLICQEMVQHGGMYMHTYFQQTSELALKLKDHREPIIHKAAISLLPVLARYSPQDFTKLSLSTGETLMAHSCNYLIGRARAIERDRTRDNESDRATAFRALGHIAQSCSIEFKSFLEPTTRAIRDVLLQRTKHRTPPLPTPPSAAASSSAAVSDADDTASAILQTIAMLATAMGPTLTRHMRDILDLMFTTGLSQALCDSLAVLEREVSQLVPAIQDRLLDMVSIILVSVPFRPAQPSLDNLEHRMGALSLHYASSPITHAPSDRAGSIGGIMGLATNGIGSSSSGGASDSTSLVVAAASKIVVTPEILVLALRTLSSFDFSEENLSEFVRNDILQYLNHHSPAVRKEAISAVSRIVLSDPLYKTMAGAGVEVASEVVQRLVAAAVTDLDPDVRLMAVKMLERGSCFDFHLGKAQNIQALLMLHYDEVFEVRLTVLSVIGRLANMNPAHIMPSLRWMVIQLLTELEYARGNSEREECIQLLMVMVRAAENWVRPYVGDIFRTILARIDDGSPQLASKLLDTVAALARVGGSDLVPFLDKLLASIMQALGDQSSAAKRMSALKALSSCASYCGLVISPYTEYPQLFSILASLMKTESSEMRHEVMRVIGALGAIDPHKYKDAIINNANGAGSGAAGDGATKATAHGKKGARRSKKSRHAGPRPNVMSVFNGEKPRETLIGDIIVDAYGSTFSGDNYYTQVSVEALLRILDDAADTLSHPPAVSALISMFGPLRSACAPYLERVVPAVLRAMELSPPSQSGFYIESLGRIVSIARQLIRPYLEPLFGLFSVDAPASEWQQGALVGLVEVLAEALSGDFGAHISTVLPFLVAVIDRDTADSRQLTGRALHALQILSPSLEGYLFLVMPRLVSLLDLTATPTNVAEATLECISSIVSAVNCSSFASRIVLKLVQILQGSQTQTLQTAVIDVLCTMMEQLQDEFALFMPTISATMKRRGIVDHAKYERYSRALFSGRLIPKEAPRVLPLLLGDAMQMDAGLGPGGADNWSKQPVSLAALRRTWSINQRLSKEEWSGWLNKLSVELLQQSSSAALRSCWRLAVKHPRLSIELFNAAFVSCWTELPASAQQEFVLSLQEAASNPDVPADILQTILSLAGFMERDEKQIQIDLKLLGEYADRCHALAKELHYKEAEWVLEKSYETIEKLIELNQNLDLHDSAIGMLNYVRKEQPNIRESVEWYQRLQRWDDALTLFRRQEAEEGPSYNNTNGQLRCLFEMSDWDALIPLYERIWSGDDCQLQVASANIGMSMAWAMGDIDSMEFYMSKLPNSSQDKSFCIALLSVYHNKFDEAAEYINKAREEMRDSMVSHITESYSRGYMLVFRCQMLTELEEVIAYKTVQDDNERRAAIISTWRNRLDGIQQDVGMWQKLLRLHSIVVRPILDLDTWIKYVNMCRKSDQMTIARNAIFQLLQDEANYLEEVNRGEVETMSHKLIAQAQEYARVKAHMLQQQQVGQGQQQQDGRALAGFMGAAKGNALGSWGYRSQRLTSDGYAGGLTNTSLDVAIRLSQQPALVYMYLKYKWAAGERKEAFQMMEMFANDYSSKVGFDMHNPSTFAEHLDARALGDNTNGQADAADDAKTIHLLSRFYFKRAEWLISIQNSATLAQEARTKAELGLGEESYTMRQGRRESIDVRQRRGSVLARPGMAAASAAAAGARGGSAGLASSTSHGVDGPAVDHDAEFLFKLKGDRIKESILESYRAATVLDRKWYKAWHSLALRHYYETQQYDGEHSSVTEDIIEKHVVPAVHGFFRAIQLSKSDTTLQDTLRLLTAWFNYSQHESVAQAVLDGFNTVSIRTWLQVIPQILARIHIRFESTSRLIKQLLVEVGKFHPHAILFSLYVAARSDHVDRSQAAKDVLAKLHDLSAEVVEETELVSRELIRITLLFPEMWQEALDNASKCYYGQNNPEEMMKILKPMHERARNPATLREYHFMQMFGNELRAAEEHLDQYFAAEAGRRNEAFMQQAWESYYVVFRRIQKLFPEPTSLALKDTAPTLLMCRDMHLAVPGTYDPDREVVRISWFDPVVFVYGTKQHPRRVHIAGSDGNTYTFVLKGHEDLRQDERVMQLFGLINSLLMRDGETARRSLAIERFPVIPLSSNSGLIGFYPNCETLHEIIRDNREANGSQLNLEQRLALQFSPNWETLTVLQKVESFEFALSNSPGNDLQRALWYKSPNAETWLERRTNYTRSLAVMSIAGYILGLGDRHPTNIMMHARTGKIVHIDLGDCFELAAQREKFPEKVPFRLTRMVIMPMEVSTIEGTFKFTANHTMRVLRANRDSLMAVLEAFVFDPLVSWSYIQDPDHNDEPGAVPSKRGAGAQNAVPNGNQQAQLARWNSASRAGTANHLDLADVARGSRPDEPGVGGGNMAKIKYDGVEDKGWLIGNPKARAIVNRIHAKLVGTDFDPNVQLDVAAQIEKLIQQATSSDNLAVLYVGWVPMW